MGLRELIYKGFHLEFPNSKPLWTPEQGLQSIISDNGNIIKEYTEPQGIVIKETPQQKRERLFDTMVINKNIVDLKGRILVANVPEIVEMKVARMVRNKDRYERISHYFGNPIRWFHIALLHEMECTQNFNCYLGNGQPYKKKTTIVPKGRGAFNSFEAGAIDAIKYDKLNLIQDWSIGNTLYILEGFNGYGYELYKGINSPYLWSGSNHYTSGKYLADSVYSNTAVSQQIGIALLYKRLLETI